MVPRWLRSLAGGSSAPTAPACALPLAGGSGSSTVLPAAATAAALALAPGGSVLGALGSAYGSSRGASCYGASSSSLYAGATSGAGTSAAASIVSGGAGGGGVSGTSGGAGSLTSLDLSSNVLTELPPWLAGCSSLRRLNLSRNPRLPALCMRLLPPHLAEQNAAAGQDAGQLPAAVGAAAGAGAGAGRSDALWGQRFMEAAAAAACVEPTDDEWHDRMMQLWVGLMSSSS